MLYVFGWPRYVGQYSHHDIQPNRCTTRTTLRPCEFFVNHMMEGCLQLQFKAVCDFPSKVPWRALNRRAVSYRHPNLWHIYYLILCCLCISHHFYFIFNSFLSRAKSSKMSTVGYTWEFMHLSLLSWIWKSPWISISSKPTHASAAFALTTISVKDKN
jgi:hypothetical protein